METAETHDLEIGWKNAPNPAPPMFGCLVVAVAVGVLSK